MIDTVILCGNIEHDFGGFQPQGPDEKTLAEVNWKWVQKMLSTSKWVKGSCSNPLVMWLPFEHFRNFVFTFDSK